MKKLANLLKHSDINFTEYKHILETINSNSSLLNNGNYIFNFKNLIGQLNKFQFIIRKSF